MGIKGLTAAGIVAAGLAPTLAQAEDSTIADGILDKNEISEFSIVEDPDGEQLSLNGRPVFQVETADGITVYGTSPSAYADGPAVSGINNILTNEDGEPITTYEDAYEAITGEELPEEPAEVAPLPGEEAAVEEAEVENPVAALPDTGEIEASEGPFAGTAFEDGEITKNEIDGYEHPVFTREEAEQVIAAGAEGTFAETIDSVEWATVETDAGTGYSPIINGQSPVSITDTFGNAFCGTSTSAYADGVTVTGLNGEVFNDESTGPATCDQLLGLGR